MTGSEMGGLLFAFLGVILIVLGVIFAFVGVIIMIFYPFGLYISSVGVALLVLGGGLLTFVLWVDSNRQRDRLANAPSISKVSD